MRRLSKAFALFFVWTIGLVDVCLAQRAVAKTDLNVRSGQTTSSSVLDRLTAGDTVTLVSAKARRGYLHVRTPGGTTGWAWAVRLEVLSDTGPDTTRAADTTSSTSSAVGGSIDRTWDKVPSSTASYRWPDAPHTICADSGKGGDAATNRYKNRADSASDYHQVSWQAVARLGFPHNKLKNRGAWPTADRDSLALYEGIPVSVTGFLSGIKVEVPGQKNGVQQHGESTNCGEFATSRVDWHMYLTQAPHQPHSLAVVVETTPRVRPQHPGWTPQKVQSLVAAGDTVRISGWLMFDPEHWDQMWQYKSKADTTGTKARITLWEIHPVTRIEARRNGEWVLLEGLP